MRPDCYDRLRATLASRTPEEQYQAAVRYMQNMLDNAPYSAVAIVALDPSDDDETGIYVVEHKPSSNVPPEVAERQAGVYNQMIGRNPDGSDPLVPEPGP